MEGKTARTPWVPWPALQTARSRTHGRTARFEAAKPIPEACSATMKVSSKTHGRRRGYRATQPEDWLGTTATRLIHRSRRAPFPVADLPTQSLADLWDIPNPGSKTGSKILMRSEGLSQRATRSAGWQGKKTTLQSRAHIRPAMCKGAANTLADFWDITQELRINSVTGTFRPTRDWEQSVKEVIPV